MPSNLEIYNGAYSGRTAYIVGSGPSIHFQDLSLITNGVIFAVNSGLLAHEKPDFFVTDDSGVMYWTYFKKNLRQNKYTVPLLYADKLWEAQHYLGERIVWFKHRTGYNLTETYSHENYADRIWQARSSVGTAIHIAYIMGCRKIVLLGIDCCYLDGHRYFWQYWKKQPKNTDVRIIPVHRPNEYNIEGSAVPSDNDLMEIMNYWNSIAIELKNKCEILNASHLSVLDCFKKVNFADVIK